MAQDLQADVVILGAGGAALRAALAAADSGASVLILTKGRLGESGVTALACSDRMAFHATLEHTEPGGPDAWRYHAEDIYRIGGRVSDANLARVLARGAADAFHYLETLGVPFARRPDGLADQFVTDGSKFARACYTGPHTANHIHEALRGEVRRRGLKVVENVMAEDLLLDSSGRAAGVRLVDGRTVRAGAVVLATGGAGLAYEINVFPDGMTGDGYAMAYRAGAELVNMEFIQFGLSSVTTKLACSGSLMRAWPRLVDERQHEFLFDFFPPGTPPEAVYSVLFRKGASWPVSREEPSHVIDIAVFSRMADGRNVYLDYSRNPRGLDIARLDPALWAKYENIRRLPLTEPPLGDSPLARLRAINPASLSWLQERGIDLEAGDRIEIGPACQHFQGGVKIDERAATTVPGLFAAGEVAGGQHGANRPGGNALMDSQVFGRIAGEEAARLALAGREMGGRGQEPYAVKAPDPFAVGDAQETRRRIQHLMTMRAGIKRSATGLAAGLAELEKGEKGVRNLFPGPTKKVPDTFSAETRNLALVAEMVLRASAARTESRGPHLTFDPPEALEPLPRRDPEWQKYLVISRGPDGTMLIRPRKPVEPDWPPVVS